MSSLAIQIIEGELMSFFQLKVVYVTQLNGNLSLLLGLSMTTHFYVTILLTFPMDPNMVLLFHISNYIGFNLAQPDRQTYMMKWNTMLHRKKQNCHNFVWGDEKRKSELKLFERKKKQTQLNQHFVSWVYLKNSTHVSMLFNDRLIWLIYI